MTEQIAIAVVALLNAGEDPLTVHKAFSHIDGIDFIPHTDTQQQERVTH